MMKKEKLFSAILIPILLCMILGAMIDNGPAAAAVAPGAIAPAADNATQMGYWLGDGDPATNAGLTPKGIAVDSKGNLYIADTGNNRIRKVDTRGMITTVAGNGTEGYSGDGGRATNAELANPWDVAVDSSGNLYIADTLNNVIRKVDSNGIITTITGNGFCKLSRYEVFNNGGYAGDNGPAAGAELNAPEAMAVDASGDIYIADTFNLRIRKTDTSGKITTVAGDGGGNPDSGGYSGDNGPAVRAELSQPAGVAVDAAGDIYISDQNNNRIRKVDSKGIITTIAGSSTIAGYTSNRELSTDSEICNPSGLAVDAAGNLYMADGFHCIRKIDTAAGTIITIAGNINNPGFSGDGGLANGAEIAYPTGVAVDRSGNIYISDSGNNRIRKVDTTGIITTEAGNGTMVASGQQAAVFTVGQKSYILGKQSYAIDAPPFISKGRTLVPVRFLADAVGAQASWDPTTKKVTINRTAVGYSVAELTIGSTDMISYSGNGNTCAIPQTTIMDVAPVIVSNRTYLPARYVAESFGFNVSWNAATQSIAVLLPESR